MQFYQKLEKIIEAQEGDTKRQILNFIKDKINDEDDLLFAEYEDYVLNNKKPIECIADEHVLWFHYEICKNNIDLDTALKLWFHVYYVMLFDIYEIQKDKTDLYAIKNFCMSKELNEECFEHYVGEYEVKDTLKKNRKKKSNVISFNKYKSN